MSSRPKSGSHGEAPRSCTSHPASEGSSADCGGDNGAISGHMRGMAGAHSLSHAAVDKLLKFLARPGLGAVDSSRGTGMDNGNVSMDRDGDTILIDPDDIPLSVSLAVRDAPRHAPVAHIENYSEPLSDGDDDDDRVDEEEEGDDDGDDNSASETSEAYADYDPYTTDDDEFLESDSGDEGDEDFEATGRNGDLGQHRHQLRSSLNGASGRARVMRISNAADVTSTDAGNPHEQSLQDDTVFYEMIEDPLRRRRRSKAGGANTDRPAVTTSPANDVGAGSKRRRRNDSGPVVPYGDCTSIPVNRESELGALSRSDGGQRLGPHAAAGDDSFACGGSNQHIGGVFDSLRGDYNGTPMFKRRRRNSH